MDWRIRLILRTAQHFLPCKYYLRRLKWSLSKNPFPETGDVLRRGLSLIEKIETSGFEFTNSTVLEIGSGWEPTIPVLMFLKGCETIKLYDLHRLLNATTLEHCLLTARQMANIIADSMQVPTTEIVSKLTNIDLRNFPNSLKQLHIEYCAPADASDTRLRAHSVDLVYSHTVLEHVPPSVISRILSETYRILKPEGRMYHLIDNSDHWAHYDKNITLVNFLKYEDHIWRFVGINPLDYQNRLRYNEYISLLTKHDFTIESSEYHIDERSLQFLKEHSVCRKYRRFSAKDLAKMGITILARK